MAETPIPLWLALGVALLVSSPAGAEPAADDTPATTKLIAKLDQSQGLEYLAYCAQLLGQSGYQAAQAIASDTTSDPDVRATAERLVVDAELAVELLEPDVHEGKFGAGTAKYILADDLVTASREEYVDAGRLGWMRRLVPHIDDCRQSVKKRLRDGEISEARVTGAVVTGQRRFKAYLDSYSR